MKKYIFKILFFVLTFTLFMACETSKPSEEKDAVTEEMSHLIEISAKQFQYMNMELGKPTTHNFSQGIKTNGFIDVPPTDRAMVSAIMPGYVKISHLLIGEKVTKGQLLLTLENTGFIEIQQNYLETFVTLNYLKSEYTRQKTLFEENISSEKNYLKAESEYKKVLAHYNGLDQKLRLMNINTSAVKAGKFSSTIPVYSPINGSVSEVNASVGKYMDERDVLVEIINNEHKHLELVIFEKDILKVKEGMKILFNLPENSAGAYKGKVHLIGNSIDATNRTVKIHGHLDEENESFLVGMFVEAEIVTNEIEKTALPASAILEEDNLHYVLVLNKADENNYYFEKVMVKTGFIEEGWIEVIAIETLTKNKEILVKGAFIPLEGA